MSQHKKTKPAIRKGKLNGHDVYWSPEDSHPSQVSGIFENDPLFEEFREILRQQREEDYRRANEEADEMIRQEKEAKGCSSLTPTPSRTTKTGTKSSA